MRMLALVVVVLFASNCAFWKVVRPPEKYEPPAAISCTTENTFSGVDLLIGGLTLVGGLGFFASTSAPTSNVPPENRLGYTAVFGALAAPFIASAVYGFLNTGKCRGYTAQFRIHEARAQAASETAERERVTRLHQAALERREAIQKEEAARLERDRAALAELMARKADAGTTETGAVPGTGPRPRLIDDKPVVGMAFFEDRVAPVAAYDDGEWRDPDDMRAVEAQALLSDPKAKPVSVAAGGWFQPIKRGYRGKEGWQKLRWGMTTAEVLATLGNVDRLKPDEFFQLAWRWKIGAAPVKVQAIIVTDRLAGVALHVPTETFDAVKDLVIAKYGEPSEDSFLSSRWSTTESIISVKLVALTPSVLYVSKVFSVLGMEQIAKMQKKQADEGL